MTLTLSLGQIKLNVSAVLFNAGQSNSRGRNAPIRLCKSRNLVALTIQIVHSKAAITASIIGAVIKDHRSNISSSDLVIHSNSSCIDNLLCEFSAAVVSPDRAGNIERSSACRGDLCLCVVTNSSRTSPLIVETICGRFEVSVVLGNFEAIQVQSESNLCTFINFVAREAGCGYVNTWLAACKSIRIIVRPCRHDDEAQHQGQSQ